MDAQRRPRRAPRSGTVARAGSRCPDCERPWAGRMVTAIVCGRGAQERRRDLGRPRPARAGGDRLTVDPVGRGAQQALRALDAQAERGVGRDQSYRSEQQGHALPGDDERSPRKVAQHRGTAPRAAARRDRALGFVGRIGLELRGPADVLGGLRSPGARRAGRQLDAEAVDAVARPTAAARRRPPARPRRGSRPARPPTARARARIRRTSARRPAALPGRRRPPCAGRPPGCPATAALTDRRGAEPPLALTAMQRSTGGAPGCMPRSAKSGPLESASIDGAPPSPRRPERERGAEAGGDEDGAGEAQAGAQRAERWLAPPDPPQREAREQQGQRGDGRAARHGGAQRGSQLPDPGEVGARTRPTFPSARIVQRSGAGLASPLVVIASQPGRHRRSRLHLHHAMGQRAPAPARMREGDHLAGTDRAPPAAG